MYGSPLKLNCLGLQWRQRLKGITDRCPTCAVLDEGVRANLKKKKKKKKREKKKKKFRFYFGSKVP